MKGLAYMRDLTYSGDLASVIYAYASEDISPESRDYAVAFIRNHTNIFNYDGRALVFGDFKRPSYGEFLPRLLEDHFKKYLSFWSRIAPLVLESHFKAAVRFAESSLFIWMISDKVMRVYPKDTTWKYQELGITSRVWDRGSEDTDSLCVMFMDNNIEPRYNPVDVTGIWVFSHGRVYDQTNSYRESWYNGEDIYKKSRKLKEPEYMRAMGFNV